METRSTVEERQHSVSSSLNTRIFRLSNYKYRTFLLHKPLGSISSTVDSIVNDIITNKKDPRRGEKFNGDVRPTIYDVLPTSFPKDCMSVGRLDFETSGLILFTDDKRLASAIRDPVDQLSPLYKSRFKQKVYELMILCRFKHETVDEFNVSEIITNFSKPFQFSYQGATYQTNDQCRVEVIKIERKDEFSYGRPDLGWTLLLHVTINEGKHHQVRRMARQNNYHIISLKRIQLASILNIDSVPMSGDCRWLTLAEIQTLYRNLQIVFNEKE